MAAESSRKRLRDEVTCAVCSDFFTEPVILNCGHNFCRACIAPGGGKAASSCPQCGKPLRRWSWKPNKQLATVAEIARELTGEAGRSYRELFCTDEHSCICVVCGVSREHRGHDHVPVEEAAEEYQETHVGTEIPLCLACCFRFLGSSDFMIQICHCLENLRKEREKILAYKAEKEKESEDLLKQTEAEKQKMVAEFRGLRQFLKDREKLLLAQMKGVEEKIVKEQEEHLARILVPLSSLDGLIQELEEKCQQEASELLQDVRSTLQRCEQKEKFENPVAFPSALKWKVWEFRGISPILKKIMTQLKDSLPDGYQLHKDTLPLGCKLQKENVTLDPDSAHPQLLISDDRKCLTLGDKRQHLPTDTRRFNGWLCVQGEGGLKSQMCYWDVEVGEEEGWAVGICRAHKVIQRDESLGPQTGVWAIGKWSGEYRAVSYPYNPPLPLSGEPKRIRLLLNFPAKQVCFFDADTAALLHISTISAYPEFQPFFWLLKKSYLRICP